MAPPSLFPVHHDSVGWFRERNYEEDKHNRKDASDHVEKTKDDHENEEKDDHPETHKEAKVSNHIGEKSMKMKDSVRGSLQE